jgi:hypothetical protein
VIGVGSCEGRGGKSDPAGATLLRASGLTPAEPERGPTGSNRKTEARHRRASWVVMNCRLLAAAAAPFSAATSPDSRCHQAAPFVARLLISLMALRRFQHTMLVQFSLEAPQGTIYRLVLTELNRQYSPPFLVRLPRGSRPLRVA